MAKSSSPLITAVIAGVIVSAIGGLVVFIPDAWIWAGDQLGRLLTHLGQDTQLPNWIFYLLVIANILWIIGIAQKLGDALTKDSVKNAYVEDRFFGAIWRWNYVNNYPSNIWAYCLRCDTELIYSYNRDLMQTNLILICETCDKTILTHPGDKEYLVSKVYRQIEKNVRTGEWKRSVPTKNR